MRKGQVLNGWSSRTPLGLWEIVKSHKRHEENLMQIKKRNPVYCAKPKLQDVNTSGKQKSGKRSNSKKHTFPGIKLELNKSAFRVRYEMQDEEYAVYKNFVTLLTELPEGDIVRVAEAAINAFSKMSTSCE
eukprot:TRINITY_DN32069_c0_g1_i1.p1 TRINITY_DN32069_c0_g1~~TRINITY_DN32069_c0_g1_i1.p1  ORF type:complete len:131 (+),score=20.76 TRINITY_DN32069_c0_g1_i1:37-429(+)